MVVLFLTWLSMNFRYPIFLDLAGKRCLVVGAGYEVPGKVRGLVDVSATVVYINPTADPRIEELITLNLVEWRARAFEESDLNGCFLVLSDCERNAEIFRLAEAQNILFNAVDDPKNCRFSFGSLHRQGDLTIAISSNGYAPALAVRLKEWLQREIGPEYGIFLRLLKQVRPIITTQIPEFNKRRDLWYRIVDSEVLAMLREGNEEAAAAEIQKLVGAAISECRAAL